MQALYLNIFRGEPAISRFVWHIAPYLKSSQPIATDTSAVLLCSFEHIQPVQGKLTWFRVYMYLLLFRSIRARFHFAFETQIS